MSSYLYHLLLFTRGSQNPENFRRYKSCVWADQSETDDGGGTLVSKVSNFLSTDRASQLFNTDIKTSNQTRKIVV